MDESYMMKTMLITSNIASVFESDMLRSNWLSVISLAIENRDPSFIVFHFQEVGGLSFKEARDSITAFTRELMDLPAMKNFDRTRIFIDDHHESPLTYTSLGCAFLVHQRVCEASLWNFQDRGFETVTGKEIQILRPGCESSSHFRIERFPTDLFKHVEWTRKGYIWTRWLLNGMTLDLVNLHLFHDDSNLVAVDSTPSVYTFSRMQALDLVLKRISAEDLKEASQIVFGDFNFRLDLHSIVREIRQEAGDVDEKRSPDGYLEELIYRPEEDGRSEPLLRLGRKVFDLGSRQEEFVTCPKRWLKFDLEFEVFRQRLFEFPITFPPSYRYMDTEDPSRGSCLSALRAPSWCDRVLLSHSSSALVAQEKHLTPEYGMIGASEPLGDHKPVFLCLHLRQTPDLSSEDCLPHLVRHLLQREADGGPALQLKIHQAGQQSALDVASASRQHRQRLVQTSF